MAAVLAVLGVIALWRVSVKGKGGAALRLAAWGSLIIVVWLMIGFKDPAEAGALAEGFASGISQAAAALADFLSHF